MIWGFLEIRGLNSLKIYDKRLWVSVFIWEGITKKAVGRKIVHRNIASQLVDRRLDDEGSKIENKFVIIVSF